MAGGFHSLDPLRAVPTSEERVNDTTATLASDNSQPRPTKRKRSNEATSDLLSMRLQTSGFSTPQAHRAHDALHYEDNLSPRTFVSSHFQSLNIDNAEVAIPEVVTWRRTKRRTSWVVPTFISGPASSHTSEPVSRELPTNTLSQEGSESAIEDLPQDIWRESSDDHAQTQMQQDIEHTMYRFSAGSQEESTEAMPEVSDQSLGSPCLSTRHSTELPNTQHGTPIASPSKRRRRHSPNESSTGSPLLSSIPVQDISGPSSATESPVSTGKRRLSSPPARISQSDSSSNSELDSESSKLWWQDSEIVGHDPADPEDDNRGVNGIGYQKTKAEQYRISERKKKQITEWRNREAREARALRVAGRGSGSGSGIRSNTSRDTVDKVDKGHRVMLGRVTKSRSGSPVERRLEEIEVRSTPRKGVRFEEG